MPANLGSIQVKEIPLLTLDNKTQKTFVYNVPKETFRHTNSDAKLTYDAVMENGKPLDSWMSFNTKNLQIRGTVPNQLVDKVTLIIKARDQFGNEASTKMIIMISK